MIGVVTPRRTDLEQHTTGRLQRGKRGVVVCFGAAILLFGHAAVAQRPADQPPAGQPSLGPALPPQLWRVGESPPDIAGIRLGDSAAKVVAALGPPMPSPVPANAAAPLHAMRYHDGGLIIGVSDTLGVVRILLRRPQGGALAGVRVGDPLGSVIRNWGEPPAGAGSVGRYLMGSWTVSVRGDMGSNRVLSIMLARVLRPAGPAPSPPVIVLPGPPKS